MFESLNNRGIPLTAVDLIKNKLLAQLDNGDTHRFNRYFDRWQELLDNLGNDYAVQERFFRQNYNAFRKELNCPFGTDGQMSVYPLGSLATRSTILSIYEKLINRDAVGIFDELYNNAEIYAKIVLNKVDGVAEQLRENYQGLLRVEGAPSYQLLLYLNKKRDVLCLGDADIANICRLLVNYFVRRNITDKPSTRYLGKVFMEIIDAIGREGYTGGQIENKLREMLRRSTATDEEFEKSLRGPVYEMNSGVTRFILCMMAGTRERDLWKKTGSGQYVWTIEHILPQGADIPDAWVEMIAGGDRRKAEEYQAKYVHTLSNLTVTGYNSTLSNRSFQEKKERKDSNNNPVGYRNGLSLNADVCDKERWTIEAIQARTERMVKEITEMFPL